MNSKRLTEVVIAIREYAANGKYTVYRNNKSPDWKNQMLNLLSDEVVRNHLMTLHPFQFTRGNDATQVYEFQIDYYRYNVYIKVNLKQREVLSFHYDEFPGDAENPPKIRQDSYHFAQDENDATAMFSDIAVIPEAANFGANRWICKFAVGSQITTVPVYPNIQNGYATIPLQDYFDAIQTMARGFQKQYLTEVIGRAKLLQLPDLLQSADSYNILSYDRASPVQLASIGFDLYNNFPTMSRAQDLAVDLLLQVPPQTLEQFRGQLHNSMYALPNLSASRETLLEDWDEE